MIEHRHEDLSGSVFEHVDLTGARFTEAHFDDVVLRGCWGRRLDLDGDFDEILYNGIDLVPLWRAEMVRRHPEFALLDAETAEGCRTVWPRLEELWESTLARARRLPEAALHERVEGEWSFIQTLRHLMFVTDAWLRRAVLHEASPYHPLDLQHDEMPELDGVPRPSDARPTLDEVLALRAERTSIVREFLAGLTDEQLAGQTDVTGPGYPEAESYAVRRCVRAVIAEEWWHHRFAERDLRVLEAR
jgi:uncharacterized damage-inducible protein DinB